MKFRTLRHSFKEALRSIKRNGLMSIVSITTVMVSLLILGILILLVSNVNFMADNLEKKLEISVYLEDNLSDAQLRLLKMDIEKIAGVKSVKFVSKEEGLENFKAQIGDNGEIFSLLEKNPLPDTFEIKTDQPEMIKSISEKIAKLDGVSEVEYGREVVEKLLKVTNAIQKIGAILIIALVIATVFLISNTIKLTVFARRKEIHIMKLVGATNWFIRWPFIFEGMILGFIGAMLASLILLEGYQLLVKNLYNTIPFIPLVAPSSISTHAMSVLIVLGIGIGIIGSVLSMRKFLKI